MSFLELQDLSTRILQSGHLGKAAVVFTTAVAEILSSHLECESLELRFQEGHSCLRCEVESDKQQPTHRMVKCERIEEKPGCVCCLAEEDISRGDDGSETVIPIEIADKVSGFLIIRRDTRESVKKEELELYNVITRAVGIARSHQQAQAALKERVKELMCLYGIAKLVEQPEISLEEILKGIVELIPPGWQYPKITRGRIILDGEQYTTAEFQEEWQKQSADILVKGVKRGTVDVAYTQNMPDMDEGPFLNEERSLIEAVAIQITQIVERRRSEEDQQRLQEQLWHADRLATIGQLAAGVAHEFNEPLGNILGFAQLILKDDELPEGASRDIEKIVTASLHAREVVKKLMLFSRQIPAEMIKINLSKIVEEGLYFLEARCTKAGIELVLNLGDDIPQVTADPSQVHQILVNLVVNAIQATPDGGRITITTECVDEHISLTVEDTGIGMTPEVLEQVFIPFFTTKDIDEGTGLGLPVVHGIVTAHCGTISVESEPGKGSIFNIRLPILEP